MQPAHFSKRGSNRYFSVISEKFPIIKRVSEAIASLKNGYIGFPEGDLLNETTRQSWRIGRFPAVVGAIHCTHIKMVSPGDNNAELLRNREGFFFN